MKETINFKHQVYQLTKKIPAGKVATYGQIAKLVGNTGASRAVGMCLGKNTDTNAVPCHRVVAADGSLTGYAFGGVKAKREILETEGVKFKANGKVDLSTSRFEF